MRLKVSQKQDLGILMVTAFYSRKGFKSETWHLPDPLDHFTDPRVRGSNYRFFCSVPFFRNFSRNDELPLFFESCIGVQLVRCHSMYSAYSCINHICASHPVRL